MTHNRSQTLVIRWAFLVLVAAWTLTTRPALAIGQAPTERQLVMIGVLATPNSTAMDQKIPPVVAAQLRKTLPGHGFKLLQVKSQRVANNQSVPLNLGDGFAASAMLLNPLDSNGKVQIKFALNYLELPQFQSIITTPTDQFNFFDKSLPDSSHLLIGVGAR